jgi:hypothetical protein
MPVAPTKDKDIIIDSVPAEENRVVINSIIPAADERISPTSLRSQSRLENANPEPALIGEFVIQLGAYADQKVALEVIQRLASAKLPVSNFAITKDNTSNLVRLTYGRFESIKSALVFANKNIGKAHAYFVRKEKISSVNSKNPKVLTSNVKSTNTIDTGWVVQFYASEAPLTTSSLPSRYNAIKNTQTATKQTASNSTLYCLISETYTNKSMATQSLAASGLNGWVTSNSNFSDITRLQQ